MNIHTLHIEHVMLLAIYTLLVVANSLLYKSMKGIHWFSLYNCFALLGAVSVALRGQIPDFISIVLGNLFVVVCYFCLFLSVTALLGRKTFQLYLQVFFVLVGGLTMLQYGYFHPNTKLRLLAYSIVLGCQQAQIAIFLFRTRTGILHRACSAMALILASLASMNFIRILGVAYQGAPNNYLQAGDFLAWIVVANTCLQCGAVVAYVWLTAALLRRDLEIQASTDPLTGLLNRRAIEVAAEAALLYSRQHQANLSVLTIDLDGFKAINDTFGHNYGDTTLIAVARCLESGLRKGDLLARTGGDEFVLLLPNTSLASATALADTLRHSIESLVIQSDNRESSGDQSRAKMSATFGLVQAERSSTWEQLITYCDKALYAGKRAGGNQISAFASPNETGRGSSSTLITT
ncbi:hypothetical protein BH10ACI4_BH10ACI4_30330 [soil metagenome]